MPQIVGRTQSKEDPGTLVQWWFLLSLEGIRQTYLVHLRGMGKFQTFFSITVTELKFGCSPLESQYSRDTCWLERKACFIQETGNLGRQTHIPKPIPKILLDDESF